MGNIRNENSYKETLIKSGSLRFLTHGEFKRLMMLVMRLNGDALSAYPGKYETERATGLSHRLTEKIDLILGKMGFLTAREEILVNGGKVWKYYLNPNVPILDKEQTKTSRKGVSHLSVTIPSPGVGSHLNSPFAVEVSHFWGKGKSPVPIKSLTTVNNRKDKPEINAGSAPACSGQASPALTESDAAKGFIGKTLCLSELKFLIKSSLWEEIKPLIRTGEISLEGGINIDEVAANYKGVKA